MRAVKQKLISWPPLQQQKAKNYRPTLEGFRNDMNQPMGLISWIDMCDRVEKNSHCFPMVQGGPLPVINGVINPINGLIIG